MTYEIKPTSTGPAPFAVYAELGASMRQARALTFSETDAQRVALGLALLDRIESYQLRLACTVDGVWRALNDKGTRATLSEILEACCNTFATPPAGDATTDPMQRDAKVL